MRRCRIYKSQIRLSTCIFYHRFIFFVVDDNDCTYLRWTTESWVLIRQFFHLSISAMENPFQVQSYIREIDFLFGSKHWLFIKSHIYKILHVLNVISMETNSHCGIITFWILLIKSHYLHILIRNRTSNKTNYTSSSFLIYKNIYRFKDH